MGQGPDILSVVLLGSWRTGQQPEPPWLGHPANGGGANGERRDQGAVRVRCSWPRRHQREVGRPDRQPALWDAALTTLRGYEAPAARHVLEGSEGAAALALGGQRGLTYPGTQAGPAAGGTPGPRAGKQWSEGAVEVVPCRPKGSPE